MRPILLVLLAVALLAPGAAAQTADAAKRIAELEGQVRALQAERALLQAELAALRDQLATLTAPAANPAAEAGTPPDALTPGTDAGSSDEPAEAATRIQRYTTALEILRELPAEMRPTPGAGWDKLKLDRAALWLRENIPGAQFRGRVEVRVGHTARQTVQREGQRENQYRLVLYLSAPAVPYLGAQVEPKFSAISLNTEGEMLQAFEKLEKAGRVEVSGAIAGVSLVRTLTGDHHLSLKLEDPEFHHPALRR